MTRKVLVFTCLVSTQWLMLCAPGFCQTRAIQTTGERVARNGSSAQTRAANDTEINRDPSKSPTAQNQSNDRSDIRLSATLRRKIMHKKSLSFDAQNIKIISENGSLVLRGPVKTEEEKQLIDSMARQCCKTMSYKNELEVKNQ